jgi:type I restriction enzyme S subunit
LNNAVAAVARDIERGTAEEFSAPEGWVLTTIGEICQINPPKPSKDHLPAEASVSFVPMAAVNAESGSITAPLLRPYGEVRGGFTAFRDGDVIVAKITPCMENGKAAIALNLVNGLGFGSTEFHVLRPSEAILPEYLYYVVRQESFRETAEEHMTGSVGQRRVPAEFIANAPILLPPLREQQRIVRTIEELLSRATKARARLLRILEMLQNFRQSVLVAACSGRLSDEWRANQPISGSALKELERTGDDKGNYFASVSQELNADLSDVPPEWAWCRCIDLCAKPRALTYGVIKLGAPVDAGIPTLRSSDVRWLYIDQANIKRISPAIAAEYGRTTLAGGEIVVTVRGTLGGIAVVPPSLKGGNVSREVAVIPISTSFDASYLACAIASITSQNWLQGVTKGVAYTGINIEDLKLLPLPVPPLAEQREIVRRIDSLFKLATAVEVQVADATRRVEGLTQAILAKAFRGELVPTEAEMARRGENWHIKKI